MPLSPPSPWWQALPAGPGVYVFIGTAGNRLYIGKAIHLRTRIRQHYKASQDGEKSLHFWTRAKSLSFYPVASDLEAVLLEARLIRLYQPPYNAISKDDKSALYITISRDPFPRVSLARKTELSGKAAHFGPFMSAFRTQAILRLARRIFRFCANPPKTEGKARRPCFYYHLHQCSGACVGKVSAPEYRQQIGYLKKFLNGQVRTVVRSLVREIKAAAKKEDYRLAAELKYQYEALLAAQTSRRISGSFLEANPRIDRQLGRLVQVLGDTGLSITPDRIECYDMATLQQKQTVGSMVVFTLGIADKSQYRRFRVRYLPGGDPNNMAEVVKRRFRHQEWPTPGLIVLDGGKPQLSVVGKLIPAGIPVVALAKKEEIIIIPTATGYQELRLQADDPALKLLRSIRDEAHRFATRYHAKLRRRAALLE